MLKIARRRSGPKRRATMVYLDPDVHRASKMRAAATGRSLSDQVNEALRSKLREDERDLKVFRERKHEPPIPYEEVLKDMKRRGLL